MYKDKICIHCKAEFKIPAENKSKQLVCPTCMRVQVRDGKKIEIKQPVKNAKATK